MKEDEGTMLTWRKEVKMREEGQRKEGRVEGHEARKQSHRDCEGRMMREKVHNRRKIIYKRQKEGKGGGEGKGEDLFKKEDSVKIGQGQGRGLGRVSSKQKI